ncbi:MAG TPA: MaoC/PaaZ C-terminal domain-containing protein [Desulfobacteraceae bacterium]|nr:MaoC/PaaZ C-terminal domain-containing protein [Desulfobacteraceae bacterium]HPJ67395.1 MaoC/PaaZ C-terminal domain-containing protein [Desulfobacteraceae bacterium]HPQ28957.1 MaoC/PaaZ C-terminal domain-containing protein [Desulfobacteraceae bacterium]
MELNSEFAGTRLKDYELTVTWRDTMNYAASIEDNNPAYFDDESPDGIIAPPMYSVAATWPVSERIGEFIDAADFPQEVIATQVHYTEHLIFHSTIRPGSRLTIQGTLAAILPHRAGTHVVIRFDASDADGAPVFTEYIGGLMRGVKCAGEGRGGEILPPVPDAPGGGDPLWESPISIDPLRPFVYDGCTGIFFPIHTSVNFAHRVGLPGIILQGTATLAYAVREITNREAGSDPRSVAEIACRYTSMVLPGSDISVRCTGRNRTEGGDGVFFEVLNSIGERAISRGYMKLRS